MWDDICRVKQVYSQVQICLEYGMVKNKKLRNFYNHDKNNLTGTLGYIGQIQDCPSQREVVWMFGISFWSVKSNNLPIWCFAFLLSFCEKLDSLRLFVWFLNRIAAIKWIPIDFLIIHKTPQYFSFTLI